VWTTGWQLNSSMAAMNDTIEFGRELIPRIRAGAIDIDAKKAAE